MDDLASPPQSRLGFLLYRAGLAVARGYERALAPIGASPVETGILSALAYDGPAHLRALARQLGLGRQTVVNATRALGARGWIATAADAQDGRLSILSVTPSGREHLARCEEVIAAFDAMLRGLVGEAAEQAMLEPLRRILDAPQLAHDA